MHPEEKLSALGLELPEPAGAVASYVPTVRTGNLVYVSGQGPWKTDGSLLVGKVGGEVDLDMAKEAAQTTCLYGLAAVKAETGDLAAVTRVVRLGVFVASAPGFTDQSQVANGASELILEVFGDAGWHARSAVGVAELPMGIPVEIDFLFEVA